jgi:hypothetical protein
VHEPKETVDEIENDTVSANKSSSQVSDDVVNIDSSEDESKTEEIEAKTDLRPTTVDDEIVDLDSEEDAIENSPQNDIQELEPDANEISKERSLSPVADASKFITPESEPNAIVEESPQKAEETQAIEETPFEQESTEQTIEEEQEMEPKLTQVDDTTPESIEEEKQQPEPELIQTIVEERPEETEKEQEPVPTYIIEEQQPEPIVEDAPVKAQSATSEPLLPAPSMLFGTPSKRRTARINYTELATGSPARSRRGRSASIDSNKEEPTKANVLTAKMSTISEDSVKEAEPIEKLSSKETVSSGKLILIFL